LGIDHVSIMWKNIDKPPIDRSARFGLGFDELAKRHCRTFSYETTL